MRPSYLWEAHAGFNGSSEPGETSGQVAVTMGGSVIYQSPTVPADQVAVLEGVINSLVQIRNRDVEFAATLPR
jgi:hypothetical protein